MTEKRARCEQTSEELESKITKYEELKVKTEEEGIAKIKVHYDEKEWLDSEITTVDSRIAELEKELADMRLKWESLIEEKATHEEKINKKEYEPEIEALEGVIHKIKEKRDINTSEMQEVDQE